MAEDSFRKTKQTKKNTEDLWRVDERKSNFDGGAAGSARS